MESDSSSELSWLVFLAMQTSSLRPSTKLVSMLFLYTPLLLSNSPFFSRLVNSSPICTAGNHMVNPSPILTGQWFVVEGSYH